MTSDGFDWADAAIGAGVLFGAALLATGSALLLKRNQPRARVRWFTSLFVVAIVAAAGAGTGAAGPATSASVGANANPATFDDLTGDAGTAPDIKNVVVSNDGNGQLTFRVNVASLVVPAPVHVAVAIDSDENAATGLEGTDYLLVGDLSSNTFGVGRWNGSAFADASAPSATASNDNGGVSFSINRSDLGNTGGVEFWVRSWEGEDATDGHFDDAPDRGTWSYELASAGPLRLAVASFRVPGSVRAGRTLTATMAATRSDSNALVGDEGSVQCRAAIGGKPVRLLSSGFVRIGSQTTARCSWRVPASAHGKTIHGSITLGLQEAKVSRQFAVRVR